MGEWIEVGPVSDCPPGACLEVVVGESIVAVANVAGTFFAIDGLCAHQGGPLASGELSGCQLTCPWHGWQYNVETGQQILSESICQTVYRARELGGTIQVALPDP